MSLDICMQDPFCTPACLEMQEHSAVSCCSSREDCGSMKVHKELEQRVAEFLKQEDAIVLGMGYATNSTIIPTFCGKGDLVISDALNHTSIVNGVRGSGAQVKVFRHNNMTHLEAVLRQAIADGQPRTHKPWKKVIIIVEGIYSMEGEVRVILFDAHAMYLTTLPPVNSHRQLLLFYHCNTQPFPMQEITKTSAD